jgi:hypothetical protein
MHEGIISAQSKILAAYKKRGLKMNLVLLDLDLELFMFQNCNKINFCCLSHPVYGILI